ncbi:MAG: S-methyl-5-thioribose-1-phosphate isomerase [Candidatus Magasanikbacteria bacterium]
MLVNNQSYRTVWKDGGSVFMIEQNLLPFEFRIFESKNYHQTCEAIKSMLVRGAIALEAAAGSALAQAFLEAPADDVWSFVDQAKKEIEATRPTAVNLFYAVKRVYDSAKQSNDPVTGAQAEVQKMMEESVLATKTIGEYGAELLKDGMNIETHCNAGWLGCVDWGTALSPMYVAHRGGKKIFVYADETRPRGQGARLTAWELQNEGVPHMIIPDNAGAHLMSQGKIDLMIVGADRIATNGDTANKIGTLEKAIAAKYYNIPFYVAAPLNTFDLNCTSGKDIKIEERSEDEVLYQTGPNEKGELTKVMVCSPGSHAFNPGFDVTPAELIAGIITEKGIIKADAEEIKKLFL